MSDKGKIVHLEEEVALLRQRLFGRKTEQTNDSATPQLPLFDEAESLAEPADETSFEEVVAPSKRRGKRKLLPSDLPRVEVTHELPEVRAAAASWSLAKKSASSLKSSRCSSGLSSISARFTAAATASQRRWLRISPLR